MILGLVMIFVDITSVPYEERPLRLLFSWGLLLAGAIVVAIASGIFRMRAARVRFAVPARIMDSFRQIEPDKSFETRNLSVLKKGDIYILLPKMFNCVYFVRSFKQTPTLSKELKLPIRIFRKKYFTDEVGGLPVAKMKGEYSIPVEVTKRGDTIVQEKYAKISGVAYLVHKYDILHRKLLKAQDLSDRFDKNTILKIIEQLSKETPGGESTATNI